MQCEDTAKLRTPLNAVCQTPDIGCVPIVNGKPDCKPQPDEIPVAFDPSTTTLWLFSCKTREWVAFQKFSMCQLSSINLDNIQNICDILQIGVNYNPGTGCRQGTISLKELAEKILECIQLQTKAVSVTANGDKLKIWVEGLEPLPPFYVKGRNIWSEGGSGTEADPLKIATHDPICQWPTKSQAQVDNANVKHIGACLDGQMSRVPFPPKVCELPEKSQAQVNAAANKQMIACVNGEGAKVPYPKMPCEFPQMTVEQVNAARDADMIVCVNGENGKVPMHDGILTPICDNPQISVAQAKAKPRLRIVSCEDGKIMLFPLPPEMFQGHYMCVPFIDGIPSGPPAEGSGPIRFDCNDDIWFWVCEENRWHRIDVGNHYHPPWKQVYDYIANRCENIKFHGWSEQDDCYTDFEMTPQELADFILCECLDPITPAQVNDAIGRGEEAKHQICVNGVSKKIDWSICSRPTRTPETLNSDTKSGKTPWTSVCVDGKNYKTNWNVCSYPELSYDDLDALEKANKNVKAVLCADGENKIIEVTKVFEQYSGVEFYAAGSHLTGYPNFYYNITTPEFAVRSRDGAIVYGSGTPDNSKMDSKPPFGIVDVTIKNDTKMLKFYMILHVSRLYRPWDNPNCSVGMMSILTASPSFCEIGTYLSDNWNNYSDVGSTSDNPFLVAESCEEKISQLEGTVNGYAAVTPTGSYNIGYMRGGHNRYQCNTTLNKNGGATQYSADLGMFIQRSCSMQYTFCYLLPGQSATISQESLITVSELPSSGGYVYAGGSHRFFVIGFPGSRSANSTMDDD